MRRADVPWQVRCLIPAGARDREDRRGLRSGGPREGRSGSVTEHESRARKRRERVGSGREHGDRDCETQHRSGLFSGFLFFTVKIWPRHFCDPATFAIQPLCEVNSVVEDEPASGVNWPPVSGVISQVSRSAENVVDRDGRERPAPTPCAPASAFRAGSRLCAVGLAVLWHCASFVRFVRRGDARDARERGRRADSEIPAGACRSMTCTARATRPMGVCSRWSTQARPSRAAGACPPPSPALPALPPSFFPAGILAAGGLGDAKGSPAEAQAVAV